MNPPDTRLARSGAEAARQVAAAAASCREIQGQVQDSRDAIARSLELLRRTGPKK